ncbi:hypothetical protein LSTR_LSTR013319 [Laodelphax striatellus]|uniref:MARVEL domain-containing protein n=1 Tax=Laodelphax striatellus TaxID=195883 RepID=A0A482WQB2_LAOST|nr:hypothetical protein LSTR_LSTR013319 [Laodelphax striatellus]
MENKTILIILSIVECIISVVLWILHYLSFRLLGVGKMELFFTTAIYGGFIFVTIGILIMVLLSEDEEGISILYFLICGAVVYIIACLFSFMQWTDSDLKNFAYDDSNKYLLKIIFSAVEAGLLIFDAVFRIMNK